MEKIEHIGIAVRDIKASNLIFEKLLGTPAYKMEEVTTEGVMTSFFKIGASKIELLEATRTDSPIAKFIEKRGEGIHHIAFDIADIHAEMKRLEGEGFVLLNPVPKRGADNKLVCFLHPKGTNGVLVELCQEIAPTPSARNTEREEAYWSERYEAQNTGWNIGSPSTPLKTYIDQISDKDIRVLVPGAGNGYEAEYLFKQGFKNVFVMDISAIPLKNFKERLPEFPDNQLIQANFFEHVGQYDLILEQTFFCSFEPTLENRQAYGAHTAELLKPKGKLVGVWFNFPLTKDLVKRPFGGSKAEYLTYLSPFFDVKTFDVCHNSIKPRAEQELFGIFVKR
ncbi:MAG: methylmalonyl-CoA epimerase [Saprospiraceae bacterium]|nr:methylmalonyl-CoA epimerase [Saprospiraceae bacterium]